MCSYAASDNSSCTATTAVHAVLHLHTLDQPLVIDGLVIRQQPLVNERVLSNQMV
jgi:hypothetical protein